MARRRPRRTGRGPRGHVLTALAPALVLAAAFAAAGCDREPRMPQETGVIVSARFDGPPGTGVLRQPLANHGVSWGWPTWPSFGLPALAPDSKLDARLLADLGTVPGSRVEELLVEYREPPPAWAPAFRRFRVAMLPDSPPAADHAFADSLAARSGGWFADERLLLARDFGASVRDSFWVTRALVVSLRLDAVRRLAARPDVEWIGYAHRGDPPPEDCPALLATSNDAVVADGVAELRSGPLALAGYATGRLSLLDTGVHTSHVILQSAAGNRTDPTQSGLLPMDCTAGPECTGEDHEDLARNLAGHGTKTCGILVGDDASGDCLDGATRAFVEIHRVYRPDGAAAELDPTLHKHACARIADHPSPVALVEVADKQSPGGSLGRDVESLYRNGVAVIAAVGNAGTYGARAPGAHPHVLSVGTRYLGVSRENGERVVRMSDTEEDQSRGVIRQLRKPDLQAPSKTASAECTSDDGVSPLSGSSGAAPYVAAAALILRNWMAATATTGEQAPDPGQVYAAVLACGDGARAPGGDFALARGAGLVRLPSSGRGWWGKVEVGTGGDVKVPLAPPAGEPPFTSVSVAIWWPDPLPSSSANHRNADLELRDTNGALLASSVGTDGVFERLDYTPPANAQGTPAGFIVHILGEYMATGPKPVYYAAITTP